MNAHAPTAYKTGPATRGGEHGAVIRRDGGNGVELVNLRWGLNPPEHGGRPLLFLRGEAEGLAGGRCLLPASEFYRTHQGHRIRFSRINGDFFYLAGLWRPAEDGWPAAYAILTMTAAPDLAPYMARQMAVVSRQDRYAWLDPGTPAAQLLRPLPAGSYRIEPDRDPDLFG